MKIAILTSGIMPVPAVQGGDVENLIDFYLDYNDRYRLADITVYSVANDTTRNHPALQSEANHYHYIEVQSFMARLKKNFRHILKGDEYYHYTIEYYFEQALRHIQTQDYDMVVIENRPGYSLKLAAVAPKTKIVHHLHNDFLNNSVAGAREIYDGTQRIVTVSQYIADRVKTIDPYSTKCLTVNNGIDLDAFSPEHAQGPSRAMLGLAKDDFVMVYSGRINREKGIRELVEAMNLMKEYDQIKLLVIGSSFYDNADDGSDEFITTLRQKGRDLRNRIVFTGHAPYNMVPGYLRLADVAVVPSMWDDPFPTSVLEAMAMGLPIITTRRGGIPEEVCNDNAIILTTDKNFVSRLAVAILDLYANAEARRQMGQMSRMLARRYDKERFAESFFQAIMM